METLQSCDHERLVVANLSIDSVPPTKLASFTFLERRYEIESWACLLVKSCEILNSKHGFRSALHRFVQYVSEYNGLAFPKGAKRITNTNFLIMNDKDSLAIANKNREASINRNIFDSPFLR